MRRFLGIVLLFVLPGGLVVAADKPARPNVIIVMTDDQGLGDFSYTGNPVLKTPNFDKFAKQSVRLTDFHVCPLCSPTRGQLLTGLAAARNGATYAVGGRSFVRRELPMMPAMFAGAGYKTGLFGKWHLGDSYPHRPTDRGFHESMYHLGWGMMQSAPEFDNPLIDGRYFHNGQPQKFEGHCTDFWFDQAISWIKEQKEKGDPFFCCLLPNAPHVPHIEMDEYVKPYQDQKAARFFGMIAHLDKRFGDLQTFLDEYGLRDDTLVIFMTDNGGTAGVATHNAGLRAAKSTYYEGGHRVPCWIRWPNGSLGQPRDIDVPTQNTDLLPTLLELCGIALPGRGMAPDADRKLFGGVSLAGLLRGTQQLDERMLVVQYGRVVQKFDACVIWNHWRLVQGEELYDVAVDRAQEINAAQQHLDIVRKMRTHYETWWKSVEPFAKDFIPIGLGARQQAIVELTSLDWDERFADETGEVRSGVGGPTGGSWHVLMETAGEYVFTLRRWPESTRAALGDRYDSPEGGAQPESKAFPTIAQAVVEIAGLKATVKADPRAPGATLTLKLPASRSTLHAWFQDENGADVCGAYFVTVRCKTRN